ncbi:MAG TPA: hypothetical protein VGB52_14380 [Actinomycetota bacterium]
MGSAMTLSLIIGLLATACTIELRNPQPSPYGHSDAGTVTITADAEVCWGFTARESGGDEAGRDKRERGCGSREIAVRTSPARFFSVSVFKTDDSPKPVSAKLVSDGRRLDRGTTTKQNEVIELRG